MSWLISDDGDCNDDRCCHQLVVTKLTANCALCETKLSGKCHRQWQLSQSNATGWIEGFVLMSQQKREHKTISDSSTARNLSWKVEWMMRWQLTFPTWGAAGYWLISEFGVNVCLNFGSIMTCHTPISQPLYWKLTIALTVLLSNASNWRKHD